MSEKFNRIISDHFETTGVDVGRHKDDALARKIADNINSVEEWDRANHAQSNGAVLDELEKEAVAELANDLADEVVREDAKRYGDQDSLVRWTEVGKSPYINAYARKAEKVEDDYRGLSQRAIDIAKDMTQDPKDS